MGQRELEEVRLPLAQGVVPPAPGDAHRPLTVNCYHATDERTCPALARGDACRDGARWRVGVRGRDLTSAELRALVESRASPERRDPQHPLTSELAVHIRADEAALYGVVQDVMEACSQAGVYRVEIGAASATER